MRCAVNNFHKTRRKSLQKLGELSKFRGPSCDKKKLKSSTSLLEPQPSWSFHPPSLATSIYFQTMSQHSKEPSHGRGSAASQGEKIRLQREQQQANRNSQIKSTSNANSNASSPKTQSKQLNETVPSRKQDKPVSDSNQAAAAAAVTPVGDKDSEKKSTQREATRDPSGKGLKIEKRIFNGKYIQSHRGVFGKRASWESKIASGWSYYHFSQKRIVL